MDERQTNSLTGEKPDIESSTEDYAHRFSGPIGKWFIKVQSDILGNQLSIKEKGQTIIDFGGGHGQNVHSVLSSGHHLTVLGSTKECSNLIQPHIKNGDIDFLTGSLLSSSLESHQFDICLSFRMLPHLENWKDHIQELCRVAKTTVIIEFPNKKSVNVVSGLFFGMKKAIEKNTRPFSLFEIKEVQREFEKRNFQLTEKIGQYSFPMAFYRILKCPIMAKLIEYPFRILGLSNIYGSPFICSFEKRSKR